MENSKDFKEIHIDGKIIKIQEIKNNVINGFVKIIDEKNNKIFEINMKDNKMQGPLSLINKDKTISINNINEKEGITIISKDKTINIEKLKNGKIHGKVLIQELKDKIDLVDAFFGNFVEGILEGVFRKENDKIKINGNFTDNKKDGHFSILKKKSKELWEVNFIKDKLDGQIIKKTNNKSEIFETKDGEIIKKNPATYILNIVKKSLKTLWEKIKKVFINGLIIIKKIILFPLKPIIGIYNGLIKLIKKIIKILK